MTVTERQDASQTYERKRSPLFIPDRGYIILPGDSMSPKEQNLLTANKTFIKDLLPDWLKSDEQNKAIVSATVDLMGFVLTSIDRAYGHDASTPGERYLADPFGENSVPMFYHNGETTRLVLQETIKEMNRHNKDYGDESFFHDPKIFLTTVIAAGASDLISDGEREDEENRTAALTKSLMHMPNWGYDFSQAMVTVNGNEKLMPDAVEDIIIASTFNEETKLQKGGADSIAAVVNDGDLAVLYLSQSTEKAICLLIEDLWRKATKGQWKQVLRTAALTHKFRGKSIEDFLSFIDEGYEKGRPSALAEIAGRNLITNAEFVDPDGKVQGKQIGHRYNDENFQRLTVKQRKENANFQRALGIAVFNGEISLTEAYQLSCIKS